jgi:hypothetical protein
MKTVPLSGSKAAGRVALVDDEDYYLVSQYRWHVQEDPGRSSGPYARTDLPSRGSGRGHIFMHCLVAGHDRPDHVDGDGLNNRRSNLRPASASQNNMNRRKRPVATSRYLGVSWHPARRKWAARIGIDGKVRTLGYFASEEEAAHAYDAAARNLFGAYARPNFPEERGAA